MLFLLSLSLKAAVRPFECLSWVLCLRIRDAASITSQEDMESDGRAAEDLTTTGQSDELLYRRSAFILKITLTQLNL